MIKGTLAPGHREKNQEKIIQEKEAAMDKITKDFEESSRKLDKVRSLLHAAGNIEVGNTPHEVIQQKRTYNLLHYRPLVSKPAKTPILIVYALINRSYILDLQPDKSWIRNLLSQGFDI